jgi:hypothetical protein
MTAPVLDQPAGKLNPRTKAGRAAAARSAIELRNARPVAPCIWDQYILDDNSLSGLAYKILGFGGGNIGPRAGCPRESTSWPHDNPMRGQVVGPLSWAITVLVGYEEEDLGNCTKWWPEYQTVEAGVVREIISEYNQELRLIAALERHLGLAVEVEVA